MRIALDMQLALGTATGIGEYARGLAAALRTRNVDVVELCERKLDPWRFDRRVLWDQVLLPRRARASGADLLHCASGTMPYRPPLPTVVTVHDVAWLKVQQHARAYARYYFGTFTLAHYSRAAAIVVDSAFSRNELLEALNGQRSPVHVVYPGVADDFCALERKPDGTRTVLVTGTVERRKNIEVLIRALPLLGDARLVSVGPFTPYQQECMRLAERLRVQDRVEFRGYVDRPQLLALYATCALVAVPSLYEGFGYAAAQALCAGVPVVVSDRSSLPEVVEGAAPIVPADDEHAWAKAIDALMNRLPADQGATPEIRANATARFSWDASARAMLRVYDSVDR